MNAITRIAAIALLGAASLAQAQVSAPNPQAPGMSIQTAIRLDATSDLMVDRAIKRWVRSHYPGWDTEPHEFMNIGPDRYAVVFITNTNNPGRRLYFRISNGTMEDEDGAMSMPRM